MEKKFKYLCLLKKWFLIIGIFDIPILIMCWYLTSTIVFYIILILFILDSFCVARTLNKLEKEIFGETI